MLISQGVYLFVQFNPWIIEDWLEEGLHREAGRQGFDFSLGSVEFLSWNSLRATRLKLKLKDQTGNLTTLGDVKIYLNPVSLIGGKLHISKLEIHGGTLNCPAIYSPSGTQETLLQNVTCTLTPHGKDWALRDFSLALHNARISGVFRDGPSLIIPTGREPGHTLHKKLTETLVKLLRTKPWLEKLESPVVTFQSGRDGRVKALLTSNALQLPGLMDSDRINLQTEFQLEAGHFLFTAPVLGKLDNALIRQNLRVTSLFFQLPTPSTETTPSLFPLEVRASSENIHWKDELVGRFIGQLRMEDINHVEVKGSLGFRHSHAELSGVANLKTKTASLRNRFEIQPEDIQMLQALIERQEILITRESMEAVSFHAPLTGELDAQYKEGWALAQGDFNIRTKQLEMVGVQIASLRANGTITPGKVHMPKIDVELKPGRITGSFRQDLKTGDYRFLLDGNLFPKQLSPWFHSWWDDIWQKFNFPGMPMQANIDVSGRWRDLSRGNIFGALKAVSMDFKEVPVQNFSCQLRCIPKYTEIFNIEAKLPAGEAKGNIAWVLHPTDFNRVTSRTFALKGEFDLKTLGKLFGARVKKVLKDFSTNEPAKVDAEGVVYGKGSLDYLGYPVEDQYQVSSQIEELTFLSIPMESLELELRKKGQNIDVHPVRFGFAGGQAIGWLKHKNQSGEPPLEFDLKLKNMDKDLALQSIARNPKFSFTPPAPSDKKAIFDNFYLHATGNYGNLKSFMGSGGFTLNDPTLAKINMLGLLFKQLQNLALPLISYRFDRMEAKFKLEKEFVIFGPEPLEIRGPTSKLDATGNLNLRNRGINFKVHFLPFGLPLAKILEMHLGGTIDKPTWKSMADPSSLLNPSRKKDNPPPFLPPEGTLPLNPKKPK